MCSCENTFGKQLYYNHIKRSYKLSVMYSVQGFNESTYTHRKPTIIIKFHVKGKLHRSCKNQTQATGAILAGKRDESP
jgi:hypothetical protein